MPRLADRKWVGCGLLIAWFILLLLPSATVFMVGDAGSRCALAVSAAFFAGLWLAIGSRWFFVVTYPLAFFGVIAVAADVLRGVNLLELALLVGPVDPRETRYALEPYTVPIAATLAVLVVAMAAGFRWPYPMPAARARYGALGLLAAVAVAIAALFPASILRAWPLNAASVQLAMALGRSDFITLAVPWAPVSPRPLDSTWSATRAAASPSREMYVVVVGESVRADRLADCGGFAALDPQAIVYCNVLAGATSTTLSVPLLLSREMPGAKSRVASDGTVLRAFKETGFKTFWIGEQEQSIAWPDADVIRYIHPRSTVREDLLPLVRSALADPAPKKALVIHSYGAHFPYCERFDPGQAPIPVDCHRLGAIPSAATRQDWLAAYDDAVAEAVAFVDDVITDLRASGDEAFLAYTSDHGENLLDDKRGLYFHALSVMTRFDTHVPMVFWASEAWRRHHRTKARALSRHRNVAAMHADLVPTLLGAADIHYTDPRTEVSDLTRSIPPPPRTRWVEPRLGVAIDGDRLP